MIAIKDFHQTIYTKVGSINSLEEKQQTTQKPPQNHYD